MQSVERIAVEKSGIELESCSPRGNNESHASTAPGAYTNTGVVESKSRKSIDLAFSLAKYGLCLLLLFCLMQWCTWSSGSDLPGDSIRSTCENQLMEAGDDIIQLSFPFENLFDESVVYFNVTQIDRRSLLDQYYNASAPSFEVQYFFKPLFHGTRFYFGFMQIFFRLTLTFLSCCQHRKLCVAYPTYLMALLDDDDDEKIATLEQIFPSAFFIITARRRSYGWSFEFYCKLTDHTIIERVSNHDLEQCVTEILFRYGIVAQALQNNNNLVIDVILLATAIFNHYKFSNGRGLGLQLAIVHFVRNQIPIGVFDPNNYTQYLTPPQLQAVTYVTSWGNQAFPEGPNDQSFFKSLIVLISALIATFGVFKTADANFTNILGIIERSMRFNSHLAQFDTVLGFVQAIKSVFETIRNFVASGYSADAFFDCGVSLMRVQKELSTLEERHAHMAQRTTCNLSFEVQSLLSDISEIDRQLAQLSLTHPTRRTDINSIRERVRTFKNLVGITYKNTMTTRVTPFAIALTGSSSIGKTDLTTWFIHQFAADNPFHHAARTDFTSPIEELDPKAIYQSTIGNSVTDAYMNGMTNYAWAGIFDDVATTSPKYSPEASATLISTFIRMINSFPYSTEQARIEDKGTIFCSYQLLLATTNVADLNAHLVATTPAAVLRRFSCYIEPTVKPDFRKPRSTQLDPLSVIRYREEHNSPNGALLPIHTFTIWHYECGLDGACRRVVDRADIEADEMATFVREAWCRHAKIEVGRVRSKSEIRSCAVCRTVGTSGNICAKCLPNHRELLARIPRDDLLVRLGREDHVNDIALNFLGGGSTYNAVFIAPLLEEMLKAQCSYPVVFLLAVGEGAYYIRNGAPLLHRILPVFLHLMCTWIARQIYYDCSLFTLAVVLHSVYNAWAFGKLGVVTKVWACILGLWYLVYLDSTKNVPLIFQITDMYYSLIEWKQLVHLPGQELTSLWVVVKMAIRLLYSLVMLVPDQYHNLYYMLHVWMPNHYRALSFPWVYVFCYCLTIIVSSYAISKLYTGVRYYCSHFSLGITTIFDNLIEWLIQRVVFVCQDRFYYPLVVRYNAYTSKWWYNRKTLRNLSLILMAVSAASITWYVTRMMQGTAQGNTQSQPVLTGENMWSVKFKPQSPVYNPGTQPEPFAWQVRCNMVKIYVDNHEMQGLALMNQFVLTSGHEAQKLLASLNGIDRKYRISYSPERDLKDCIGVICAENIYIDSAKDFAIIEFPASTQMKDITKYFLGPGDVIRDISTGTIVGFRDGNLLERIFPRAAYALTSVSYETGPLCRHLHAALTYVGSAPFTSQSGDCGSAVFVAHRGNCAIYGIHVAGNTAKSLSLFQAVSLPELVSGIDSLKRRSNVLVDNTVLYEGFASQGKILSEGVHKKCPLNYLDDPVMTSPDILGNLGSMPQRLNRSTNFRHSPYAHWWSQKKILHLCEKSLDFNIPLANTSAFVPPRIEHNWVPKFRYCAVSTGVKELISTTRLAKVKECLFSHLTSNSQFMRQLRKVAPLFDSEALNGIGAAKFIKPMNMSTSAGFPYSGTKKDILIKVSEYPHIYDLTDRMKATVAGMEWRARRGYTPGIIFSATHKDESVSAEKATVTEELREALAETDPDKRRQNIPLLLKSKYGKIRIFQAANIEGTFFVRKYYLALAAVLQEFSLHTGIAVGTNCFSKEWQHMIEYLKPDGWDSNFICGDFSNYDQRMGREWMLCAWDILRDLLLLTDYAKGLCASELEEYKRLLDAIAWDISNPTTIFFGDVLRMNGTNASGHPLTVQINCLANMMYMIYAFQEIYPDRDFFECVRIMTYGDDNILNVRRDCEKFTQPEVTMKLAQINVIYTAADKSVTASDYVKEPTFLKRTWRYVTYEEKTLVLCPIEFATIQKMLTMETKKNEQDSKHRTVQVLGSAILEFIQYGRSAYEQFLNLVHEFVIEHHLSPFVEVTFPEGWPDYDEYMKAWGEGEITLPRGEDDE